MPSKNQNPREGIETEVLISRGSALRSATAPSKNQNPREGIETLTEQPSQHSLFFYFKKPKSPRGD